MQSAFVTNKFIGLNGVHLTICLRFVRSNFIYSMQRSPNFSAFVIGVFVSLFGNFWRKKCEIDAEFNLIFRHLKMSGMNVRKAKINKAR